MRSRLYKFYWLSISGGIIFILLAAIFFLKADYNALVHGIAVTMNKNGLEEKIKNEVLTKARFALYRKLCIGAIIAIPFLWWVAARLQHFFVKRVKFVGEVLSQLFHSATNVFKENTRKQNVFLSLLLIFIVALLVYKALHAFLTYDEMWCANYYTENPFYYSFFSYNTYPLYELSTHIFKWLPFSKQLNLRLPSIVFGIISFVLFYICIKKYTGNHFAAVAAVVSLAFTPIVFAYAHLARGAIFSLFFAIAGVFSFLFLLNNADQKKYLLVYCIAGILGIYSVPTHSLLLFFLFISGLWLFRNNRPLFFAFLKTHFLIFIGASILYAPMLIVSGFSAFHGKTFVRTGLFDDFKYLIYYGRQIFWEYSRTWYVNYIVFYLALPAFYIIRHRLRIKQNFIFVLMAVLPILPLLMLAITGVASPERTVLFCALAYPIAFCFLTMIVEPFLDKAGKMKDAFAILFVLLMAGGMLAPYLYKESKDESVAGLSGLLIKKQVRTCYDNSAANSGFFYYYPGIEFYSKQSKSIIWLTVAAKNSIRYKPLLPADDYDCIVYNSNDYDSSRAASYKELYRDPKGKFKIWIKNEIK